MPYCSKCGREIEAMEKFCLQCGQETSSSLQEPPVKPREPWSLGAEPLPLGEYLKDGWTIFKQYPGGFIGFTVLCFAAQVFLNYLSPIGGIISFVIYFPLIAGYFVVSAKLLQQQPPRFNDFFAGFQGKYFLPLILAGLVSTILMLLGTLCLILPGIYLAVCYLFIYLFILDERLDFWVAMEMSRRSVQRRWWGFFAFVLLILLINLGGALLLGVGLLVTMPFSYCAITAAYGRINGFKSAEY